MTNNYSIPFPTNLHEHNAKFVASFGARSKDKGLYIYVIRQMKITVHNRETVSPTGDRELIYEQLFGQRRRGNQERFQRGGIHPSPKGWVSKRKLICPRRAKTRDNCARD